MSVDEIPDRRRFRRRTVRVLVEYRSDAGLCCETATTLGAGGLYIETDDPLPIGTPLKLAFTLPGSDVCHEIEGSVAWFHQPPEGMLGSEGMGVSFQDKRAVARLARELRDLRG
ncbi:MAG: PilZ domain-containing protein [Myxococcota bacterium]